MTDAERLEEIRANPSANSHILLAELERLRGVARRAYDAFSLSAQYTDQERFLAMKALGLALGLVDPGAQVRPEAKL